MNFALGLPALALSSLLLAGTPLLAAQAAASSNTDASSSAAVPDDGVPPITVQIEPPPISISSSMIGVAGPLGAQPLEGKPLFAQFVTEQRQNFTDGNHISRSTTSVIYRDAKGRIRRESQLSMPGLPESIASATYITIVDRQLGCGWVLNPQEMVAHRYHLGEGPAYMARLNAQGGGRLDAKAAANNAGGGAESGRWRAHGFSSQQLRLPQEAANAPGAMSAASGSQSEESGSAGAPAMRIDQPFLAAPNPVRTENLGEQMILGFRTHGTRVITTILAGEIGNVRPIAIVSEQWFSPDLGLVMRSTHRDPWGGEFTTTVTRISRGEQPAALFAVPAQYQVIDADTEGEHHVLQSHGSHTPGNASW